MVLSPDQREVQSIVSEGEYTVADIIAKLKDKGGKVYETDMIQRWRLEYEPYQQKFTPSKPMNSGQRIIDTLFPIAKGGTGAVPGRLDLVRRLC